MVHPLAARITAAGKRRQRPEEALQRAATDWMRLCVPPPPAGPAWSAVNPIPGKTKAAAGTSKAMGMRPGVDDWFMVWRGQYIGLEWKAAKGRQSEAQSAWEYDVEAAGGKRFVCRSIDDLREVLALLGVPTREAA
jgi:hypothetical protein